MSNLQSMQKDFMGWLLKHQPGIQKQILGTEKVSVDTRLGIYGEAYRLRLLEAMQDSYPALHTLLGDDRFEALVYVYLDRHPSQHYSIRYFGHQLSDFLATDADYQQMPVLAEMALFEWTLRDAFDAENRERLTTDDLASVAPEDWPDLVFEQHPSVRRIDLRWDVPKLWQAIEQDAPPVQPTENDFPIVWLIWRKNLTTYFRSLDVDEAWALEAAGNQGNFEAICSGLCEWVDEVNAAERAAGFLARWVQEGLIIR